MLTSYSKANETNNHTEVSAMNVFDFERYKAAKAPSHSPQPLPLVSKTISRQVTLAEDEAPAELRRAVPMRFVLKDHIPYFNHPQATTPDGHVFHPMRLGRFLLEAKDYDGVRALATATLDTGVELPNGAIAWYYPKCFNISRMQSNHLVYSCISQGTLLSAFAYLEKQRLVKAGSAERIFGSLLYEYEEGGVNLRNHAMLEIPLFASAPEIILNGWIDSLLHVNEYCQLLPTDDAIKFLDTNFDFLCSVLPNFDHEGSMLSLYSDLTPYRLSVTANNREAIETFTVFYQARDPKFPDIMIKPTIAVQGEATSRFENHICRVNGRKAHLWVSLSQHYDTYLLCSATTLSASVNAGRRDYHRSAPGFDGANVNLQEGFVSHDLAVLKIEPSSTDTPLLRGYPTNFLKDGTINFYHSHHIAALYMLSLSPYASSAHREVLVSYAHKWLSYMQEPRPSNLVFAPLQEIQDLVNRSLALPYKANMRDIISQQSQYLRRTFWN